MSNNRDKSFGNLQNRCRQCKKLFCCSNCRLAHEQKKHSDREVKCPLCCLKKLQIKGDESHEFICHLVFQHLPLLCRLCGQSFNSSEDLKNLLKCSWWKSQNSRRVVQLLGKTIDPITPKLEVKKYLDSRKTVSAIKQSRYFVTLNSPPVLIRNTSTPMINGPKTNFELRSSNSVSFFLKTSRSFSQYSEDTDSQPFLDNNELRKCHSDNLFYNRSSSQSKSLSQSISVPQSSLEYYTCERQDSNHERRSSPLTKVKGLSVIENERKKKVKKKVRFSDQTFQMSDMTENDEFFEALEHFADISLDNSVNHDNALNIKKENKVSLEERNIHLDENNVCFEHEICAENKVCSENVNYSKNEICSENNVCLTNGNIYIKEEICLSETENDVEENVYLKESNIYLNRDNLDSKNDVCLKKDLCLKEEFYPKENACLMDNISVNEHFELKESFDLNENVSFKENIPSVKENSVCFRENEFRTTENKNHFDELNFVSEDKNNDGVNKNKKNEFQDNCPSLSNSISSETSSTKSQQSESSQIVMMLVVDNSTRLSRSDLVPLIDTGLKKWEKMVSSVSTVYHSISNLSSPDERNSVSESNLRKRSSSSVNTFFTVTSTECFTAQSGSLMGNDKTSASYEHVESSKSDGILTTMARVMRNALKKIPGTTMLQESSESTKEKELISTSSSAVSTSQLSSSLPSSQPCLEESVNHSPIKRRRDLTSPAAISSKALEHEDKSPTAKRQRGWYKYKVRARQPIARMRKVQAASPRGVSSVTQRFQQGSLSAGRQNTIIPLPSRAHQFTQTEK